MQAEKQRNRLSKEYRIRLLYLFGGICKNTQSDNVKLGPVL